jgi:hypothetical protein
MEGHTMNGYTVLWFWYSLSRPQFAAMTGCNQTSVL